jgi:P4 family phage/plasmid primase-like protien
MSASSARLENPLPVDPKEAAHWWYEFGFNVAPLNPETKHTRLKWEPWLIELKANGHAAIDKEWRDTDLVCMVTDNRVLVLDADSPESLSALHELEKTFDLQPSLVAKTKHGEHHFFRRNPAETFAKNAGYSTKSAPNKIDVRTGRTLELGRGIIALPPANGRELLTEEASDHSELLEVDQDFIDAIFRHNGEEPPRERENTVKSRSADKYRKGEIAEILTYIRPPVDYEPWFAVLAGVYEKTLGSNDGLLIVDEWSASGRNYCGFEELEYKWHTLSIDGGITFGSVCKMAQQSGADLKDIAKRHRDSANADLYADLIVRAREMGEDTPPEKITQLMLDAKTLDPVRLRKVQDITKVNTKTPLGILNAAIAHDGDGEEELDHLELARVIVRDIGEENVLCDGIQIWRWKDNGVWSIVDDRTIKQSAHKVIPNLVDKVTKSTVDGVLDLFKTEINKPSHQFNQGDTEAVNCLNGELHLVAGTWELLPHYRGSYRTTQIPVKYDPNAKAPRFEQFLAEIFAGDDDASEKAAALLELMGYTLMAHCRHEKFAMLIGGGANGKSVLLEILEALCGRENVAGVQPSQFGRSFQRAHLQSKLANIVTEIKQGEVIEDAALKGIVSGEPATVEHKNKDPFTLRPFSTCWFATNHMPHTRDFSDGLFRRALIITFNNRFNPTSGNCDPLLSQKLKGELPGILNLVLAAYAKALSMRFTTPASTLNALREWRMEADQAAQFVDQACEQAPEHKVKSGELYSTYEDWARDEGIKATLSKKSLTTRLVSLGFVKHHTNDGRYIRGLRCTYSQSAYQRAS